MIADALEVAHCIRPYRGERVAGDAVVVRRLDGGVFVGIVDVLGHGPEAHEVAQVAEAFLGEHGRRNVCAVLHQLHERLRGSRGAAAGLCWIDADSGKLAYTGIGNTSIRRFGENETRLVSRDGVVGERLRTPHEQTLELGAGDLVVLHTDGISDRFGSDDYPGLLTQDAAVVAPRLVQRFGKDHDDAACIAIRYRP